MTSPLQPSPLPSTLPLHIDTAYFAFLPYDPNYCLEKFAEECDGVQRYLSKHKGVDIYLNHHFSLNNLHASALFIDKAPNLVVTHDIRTHCEHVFSNEVLCQQAISLGETTIRGGGGISLFEGAHLFHFHGRAINPKWWMVSSIEIFPVRIITGVQEIDVFFDTLVQNLTENDIDSTSLLDKLSEVVCIIRKWLSDEPRVQCRSWKYCENFENCKNNECAENCENSKPREYREYNMRITKALSKAFTDLYSELLPLNLNLANECKNMLMHNVYTIRTERYKNNVRLDFPPVGKRLLVSERLHWYNERNQKQLEHINTFSGILVVIAAALFAVVYKAVADLVFISPLPLPCVAIAVFFNFLAAIHALISYFPQYVDLLRHILPASNNPNNQDVFDPGNYREQLKYRGANEDYAFRVNELATAKERVVLSQLDFDEAGEVIKKANQIYYRRIQVGITIAFYIIALIFYAIASFKYSAYWWVTLWQDTLLNLFR